MVVTARKSAVKSITAGWKRCVSVCSVEKGLVDLGRVAIWKADLGSKKVGHHCWMVMDARQKKFVINMQLRQCFARSKPFRLKKKPDF